MKKYVCLMMDVKASKSYDIQQRNRIQKYMIQWMQLLNQLFQSKIIHAVVCSAGDEMQGVFDDASSAYMYFRLMELLMAPVVIRGGMGVGEWTIRMEDESSTYQDGPLFHAARKAIEQAHASKLQRLCIEGIKDYGMNILLNASYPLKQQQNQMQNLTMSYIECLYPFYESSLKLNQDILLKLINLKQHYYAEWNESEKYDIHQIEVKAISLDAPNINDEALIMVRNMSLNIANHLGCSRQNADKLIKRGYVYQIRQLDYYVIHQLMKEEL